MAAVPPYGDPIREAIASGDLNRMKKVQREAENYLREWGNVPAALEALKLEIKKCEYRK